MDNILLHSTRINATGDLASGSATATFAATTGRTYFITDIAASSANSTTNVELFDNSGTVYFRSLIGANNYIEKTFKSPLMITSGNSVTLRTGTTSAAYVNLGGYYK